MTLSCENVKQNIRIIIRVKKFGYTLGVGETFILPPPMGLGRKDQTFVKSAIITINETSKKLLCKNNQLSGITNYLKINLKIGIEYLFSGNSSNPDIQIINKNLNNLFEKITPNTSYTPIKSKLSQPSPNKRINDVTHISGPHRTQSVDQGQSARLLQNYINEKTKGFSTKSPSPNNTGNRKSKPEVEDNNQNNLDMTNSFVDNVLEENQEEDFYSEDSVSKIANDILMTYNDNLLNK